MLKYFSLSSLPLVSKGLSLGKMMIQLAHHQQVAEGSRGRSFELRIDPASIHRLRFLLPVALDGVEAERLVLDQCSAQRAPELLPIKVRFRFFKKSVRLQVFLSVQ